MNDSKRCYRCKQVKPLACFSKHASRPDGYQFWCKTCVSESAREKRHAAKKPKPKSKSHKFFTLGRPFVRSARKPTVEELTSLDDQELLDALLEIPNLTPYVVFLRTEAERRSGIYHELMHLVLQYDPEHQRIVRFG